MAGTNPAFSPTAFRSGVRAAMVLGAPPNPADRLTFRWTPAKTATSPADPGGIPYDLSSGTTSSTTKPDVQVPAGVRLTAATPVDTQAGEFDPTKLVLTILDDDYAKIQGADRVLYNSVEYEIEFAVPEGLFSVTVWTVYARSATQGPHRIAGS